MKNKVVGADSFPVSVTPWIRFIAKLSDGAAKLAIQRFLGLLFVFGPCPFLFGIQGGPVSVGYLVDEMFGDVGPDWTHLSNLKFTDWEVDARAGNLTYSYWQYALLTDASPVLGLEMRKRFLPQTAGSIMVEFSFTGSNADGRIWSIRSGRDLDAVKFMTSGGSFGYENSAGVFVPLVPYSYTNTAQNMTVRALVYPAANRFDVFINGATKASWVAFRNSCPHVDQFFIGTSPSGTDSFRMNYLTIVKGFSVYERFTNATEGGVPSGWGATAAGGVCAPVSWQTTNTKDLLSFKMEDTSNSQQASLNKAFPAIGGKMVWEFKFLQPVKFDNAVMFTRDASNAHVVRFNTSGGDITCPGSDGNLVLWDNYRANVWYTLRAVSDTVSRTTDYYVNGKLCAERVPFPSTASQATAMSYGTSVSGTGVMWLDDIYLYPFTPEPEDCVPDIRTVAGTSHAVGMQTFFAGWRPGHHGSWDWLYRFPKHDPYLGFYDEGTSETMDWQLKWMSEAGVDYFMDDWYRSPNSAAPMKEPLFQYTQGALNEGYFYSKNLGNVKFAIADYSLASVSAADFRAHILPYWMEYYFRDTRYMTVDNKAVIGIGFVSEWISTLGGTAAMKAEMDNIRAELVNLGYGGVIILARSTATDAATLAWLKSAGMDACYAYNFSTTNISTVQNNIATARNNGAAIDFVPVATVYHGKNGEAWDQSNPGMITYTDFELMGNWVKNTYMPSVAAGLPGRSMVLYANWNEYGEGSFIAPTNLTGFEYLNRIRSVFATAPYPSVNDTPTGAQKARMNTLYARAWDGRFWGFDSLYPDTEGWTANSNVLGLVQDRGFLNGAISGADPVLFSRVGYAIPTATYSKIVVRMKNMSAGTTGRIYFVTSTNPTYNQGRSKSFALTANDANYREYVIDMAGVSGWTGNLTQIRLDPVDTAGVTTGSFSIDHIKIIQP